MVHTERVMVDAPSPAEAAREFAFTAADFSRVRALIRQHAGIHLHDGKQAMVYSRVSRRLRATGHRSFGDYLQWLQGLGGHHGEWQEFVNCLTTNLTAFFREDHHFQLLTRDLPALMQARRGSGLRIWCSASSTGEEPYSLAMTVLEVLGANAPVQILASDIDTKVLAKASSGIYDIDSKGLSPERLKAHFLRGTGPQDGLIRVKPHVAKLVSFLPLNLMDEHWALGDPFDIVFCRNVMIYFDHATQRQVLQGIHSVMNPGGLLYVGHSENFNDARDLFSLRGKTVYQRR
jgi:chemotaxis protein methyltransferase CheR